MIKKLNLKSFGKFKDKEFEFSDVTVFFGRNESGKTTIFDALFDNLCSFSGTNAYAKALKSRYGDKTGKSPERVSDLDFINEDMTFDANEFMSLYAVKEGDVSSSISSDNAWMTKIQASLFTGGVNPDQIRDTLETRASTKGSLAHMRQITAKTKERDACEKQLESVKKQRTAILEQEKGLGDKGKELNALRASVSEKSELLRDRKTKLEQQDLVRKKNVLYGILEKLTRFNDSESKLNALSLYKNDDSNAAKVFLSAAAKLKEENSSLQAKLSLHKKTYNDAERDADNLKGQAETRSRCIQPLNELLEKIDRDCPKSTVETRIAWNPVLIIAAVISGVAGFAAAVALNFSVTGIALMGAALLAGGVIAYLSRKKVTREISPDIEPFTRKMIRQWSDVSGETVAAGTSLNEFKESLIAYKLNYKKDTEQLALISARIAENKTMIVDCTNHIDALTVRINSNESALRAWYEKMKVSDLQEYAARLQEYKECSRIRMEIANEIERFMTEYQCDSAASLRTTVETMAGSIEKETSGIVAISDGEYALKRKEVDKLVEELRQLEEKERSVSAVVERGAGQISGSMGNIPEQICSYERQIESLTREIAEIDLNRRAAEFAASIFDEISNDSSIQFECLSREIAENFGGFMPGTDIVQIPSLTDDDIRIKDSGGEARSADHLSTGTRDSFWFAARLSLARKSNPDKNGIIVLDEPFHSMDSDRVGNAVKMLKKFKDDSGWQIVVFTKDELLNSKMRSAFGTDAMVHAL